jgi:hypothetical protein
MLLHYILAVLMAWLAKCRANNHGGVSFNSTGDFHDRRENHRAQLKPQKVVISKGKVVEYRVQMKEVCVQGKTATSVQTSAANVT